MNSPVSIASPAQVTHVIELGKITGLEAAARQRHLASYFTPQSLALPYARCLSDVRANVDARPDRDAMAAALWQNSVLIVASFLSFRTGNCQLDLELFA